MATASTDSFVHLHVHTEYSMLDGAVRIPDLMDKAARRGMPAVAMTDHGNLHGAISFLKYAKKYEVKPIIGCEIYLAPGDMTEKGHQPGKKKPYTHLTLLAKDEQGYGNLVRLVTKAHLEGMYYKPRADKATLARYSEGLICLSGCVASEINQSILDEDPDMALSSMRDFTEIYGKDNFYLELMNHGLDMQTRCNEQLMQFAADEGMRTVATNDVHFINKADHEAHDVMICIGTGKMVHDNERMRYPEEVYFKTPKEMRKLFKDAPGACDATLEIAERCGFDITLDEDSIERYPLYDPVDEQGNKLDVERNAHFRKKCYEGLEWRYGKERADTDEILHKRLEKELDVLITKGFVSYFYIVEDFMNWAREQKIPIGPGRGSAAGSLIAYSLGITDLCPMRFGLIFERFLNPERKSPPDIDIDFCQTRRPEVIQYVREKYGEKAVSHVITFGTLGAKSVIRDVSRVLGMSFGEGDRLAKMIPTDLGTTLTDARKKNPELREAIEKEESTAQLWKYATFLEGLTRGVGVHAAGVIIADRDLDEFVPLTRAKEGEVVTQFPMGPLTDLGLLKMDFLGLKTLTVIHDAEEHIVRKPGFESFDVQVADLDDPATYVMLGKGETVGVFQMESGGMAAWCQKLGVNTIEDIIALLALYRPGPMDLIPDFVARKHGKTQVKYLHPLLEEVSRETYGILIYQEQVQQAANLLAGYSLGQADELRRAMGKKKQEVMDEQRSVFVDGCKDVNQIAEKQANAIFDLLEKFAGYGFNKSHSAAYGLVTFQTAYLKANHPVEFMAAVLSNEINNTDKISQYVAECQRMGIEILPPDVNRSWLKFAPEKTDDPDRKVIRYGLAAVKNVGSGAMEEAIKERAANGPFGSLEEFANRVDGRAVNRKLLEALVQSGAFDFTGEPRNKTFVRVGCAVDAASAAQKDRRSGQVSLFDEMELATAAAPPPSIDAEPPPTWTDQDILAMEKELLGFYVTGHPLDAYRGQIQKHSGLTLGELQEIKPAKKPKVFAGYVESCQIKYTKRDGKPFAVFKIEDFTGSAEAIAWSDVYLKKGSWLKEGLVIKVKARVEQDSISEQNRLVIDNLRLIDTDAVSGTVATDDPEPVPVPVPAPTVEDVPESSSVSRNGSHEEEVILLRLDSASPTASEDLGRIREIVTQNRGGVPLRLCILAAPDGREVFLDAGPGFSIEPSDHTLAQLSPWLPSGNGAS